MNESKEYNFMVGTIIGVHGIQGQLKLRPNSNNPRLFLKIESIVLEDPKKQERKNQNIKSIEFDRKMFFVKLDECNTRNDAEALVGYVMYTQKHQLCELDNDEWWVRDLVGLPVFAKTGEKVGEVLNVLGEKGEWLEVSLLEKEGKTALIPFVKELVPLVDVAGKRVEINTEVQGLLD